jgi:hypothetical protein
MNPMNRMNRKIPALAIWPMWLALPLTALHYWRSWDRLPTRMAVHFDADWQPNGWTSREGSLLLALGITAFMLVIFTIGCYAMSKAAVPSSSTWAIVVVFYGVLGLVFFINRWIVERNLGEQRPVPVTRLAYEVHALPGLLVGAVEQSAH